ncbi:hypothetical protein [Marivita sp. GX14005]|uniref:hypothetical protein n=1 Tax=Marivita sp. GX14005 TaxID=2942276 RepID=UPI0020188E26|nr:hypothetical protein [Marivita sp. GX14005]MCL3882944.1 hypothetical protein [Marivita sp. GX14005]
MDRQQDYQAKLDAQLAEWKADIAKLQAKAEAAGAEAREDVREAVEGLQKRRETLKVQLKEMRKAQDSAWDDIKKGADDAWDDIERAFNRAWSRFS